MKNQDESAKDCGWFPQGLVHTTTLLLVEDDFDAGQLKYTFSSKKPMDWILARESLQLLELKPSWPRAQHPPDVDRDRIGLWKSSLGMDISAKWYQRLPVRSTYQWRKAAWHWTASHLPAALRGTSGRGVTSQAKKRDRSQLSAAGHSLSQENPQLVAYSWICHHTNTQL